MFDFAMSEIALIGVVALIAIGPKDLPIAIKAVTGAIKKARRMASEFQTHVDEMVKEADLTEVRDQFNKIRNFDIKSEIEKAVDGDGTIASTFNTNPLDPATFATPDVVPAPPPPPPKEEFPDPATLAAPAFIPPEIASPPEPPAFIPPDAIKR